MTLPRTRRALLRPALAAAVALGALCGAAAPLRAADVTLGIRSLNPDAGVIVGACCGDVCTLQITPTPYDLVCPAGSAVNLSAPPTSGVGENEAFTEWRWGTPPTFFTADQVTQITVTGNGSVTAVYGTPPPVVTHPDFSVDSIVLTPASPVEGATFSAAVTVSNRGESHLGLGYLAIWKDRAGEPACSSARDAFNAFSIPAGESRTLTFTGLFADAPGARTFRAFADDNCGFAEGDEADNHATVSYTVRPRWTLDVRSDTPSSGVPAIVGTADTLGRTDGTTPFSRFYADASTTTLEVPPFLPSGNLFQHWLKDGSWYSDERLVTVEMLAAHVMTAVFAPPPVPNFTVPDVTVMPTSPTAGAAFRASVTVRNTGTVGGDAGTLALWTDKLFSSACIAFTTQADFTREVGWLEAGESRIFEITDIGPLAATGANRYLRAYADATCLTTELSETDNQNDRGYLVVTRQTKQVSVDTLDGRSADVAHTMDVSGRTTGRTPFTRTYPTGTSVTLTAPAAIPASSGVFQKWVGLEPTVATDPAVTFLMNVDRGVKAVYVGPGAPDFAVTGIVLDPPEPPAGGAYSATVTITNVGSGRGVPGTLKLFPDRGYAASCWAWTPYGPGYVFDLAAGASLTRTVTGIPAGTRGAKTLLAFVDDFCETDEPDEGNNQYFLPYTTVNVAPVLGPLGDREVAEGATLTFTVGAIDANGDPLTYEATGLPDGAGFDPGTRTFTWTPGYEAAGSHPGVRFAVGDGEAGDEETITITVTPTNRAPWLDPVGDREAVEGAPFEIALAAGDPDGDAPLLLEAANLPPWASFDAGSGVVSGTPGFDQAGRHEGIVLTVTDPGGAAASETIAIEVADPAGPVFADDFSPLPAAGPGDWLPLAGSWSRANGVYTATSGKLSGMTCVAPLAPGALPLGAGIVQARVKLTATATGSLGPNALLLFAYADPDHYRWVRVTGANVRIGQKGKIDGVAGGTKRAAAATIRTGAWNRFTVRIEPDGRVRVFKGGAKQPLVEHRFLTAAGAPSVVPGGVGLATTKAKAAFDEVVVWEDSALAPPTATGEP